ncbi:hypothetical protein GDO86_010551 [Hymenochirus boettgeri]|uniref:Uncharacterized protein n=1 Tax=Hymenochirus boettgeri TaxID=247094 RepID=A0A8T2JKN0_9PIPI|nr:hypothetical protein GDO86_010551 [Hymenochirus boettgeri]
MDFTYSVATYFVLALVVLNILNQWNKGVSRHFPPGPKGWPLIGNLLDINLKKPHLTYIELSKTYGPVFSIQMGVRKIVVLAGYETVKDALVNHAEVFGARAELPIFLKMDKGHGIISSNGENWKTMRRFAITTLRDFGMGKNIIEQKIMEECNYLIQYFSSFKGKPFNDEILLNSSVANIIVAILLGHRMNYEDPTFLRLLHLNNENIRLLASPMVQVYNILPILEFLPGCHKIIIKNIEDFCEFIRSKLIEHWKCLDVNDQRSLIDVFFLRQKQEAENKTSYFYEENLVKVVRNLFTAGTVTTATTLRWGLLLMMKYPDIQEKVQDEISRVTGSMQPNYSHRLQMPYTNAVVHEVQRFTDLLPLSLPHETTTDIYFKGYFIPKGTYIIPLLSSVLKDETQFDKPDEFNPCNFLDSDGNFVKKEAFMPFSAGRRVCAGETLARMEVFLFFTSLLQKFKFCPPPGVTDIDISSEMSFTNSPVQHMICAIPRT